MNTFLGIFDSGWWNACTKNATFEILLMLLAAGLIGWLLHRFRGSGIKKIQEEWQGKYDKLSTELNNAQKSNKKLKGEMDANAMKLASVTSITGDNEKLKARTAALQTQLDGVNKEFADAKASFETERKSLASAAAASGELELLKSRLTNLTNELAAAKKNADAYKASFDTANAEKLRLSASLQGNETETLKQKLQKLESDLNSSRLLVTKYQTESKDLDERKAKVAEEAKAVNEQRAELEGLKSRVSKAEEELTRARTGLAELAQTKNDLAAAKSEKEKWESEANVQAKSAAEALQWRDKAGAFERDLNAARQEAEKYKSDYAAAKAEHENLSAALSSAKASAGESESLVNRINILESEKNNLASELNHARSAAGDVNVLKARLQTLENDLATERTNHAGLRRDYDALLAEKNTLAAKAASPAPEKKYDDLEIIEGIGPKIEKLLYKGGIHTYCELADTSPEKISGIIIREGGESYRIHDPGTWPEQAALLCAGKRKEFEELAAKLKGGKRVAAPAKKDDLKQVEGIGPKIEGLLHKGGIISFRDLADAEVNRLKEILAAAGERYKMHDPTTWPKQAGLLADGKMEEFQKLTDKLKGGRMA